jgi:hypothetical protein
MLTTWLAAFDLLYYRAALRIHDKLNVLNDINELKNVFLATFLS